MTQQRTSSSELTSAALNGAHPHTATAREAESTGLEELAVICHELRNSLTVVRGVARRLRTPGNDDLNTACAVIDRHVGQMSGHIDDLLQPFRRTSRDAGMRLARVDLRVIARYALDSTAAGVARHRHRLQVELPAEPVWVDADGIRLEQALSNLLINAIKFTPDGGTIVFILERDAASARIRIRDSGIGIEPAMLSRVFEMFVQSGTTLAGREAGRGIGLAVVRAAVERHGGTVAAASAGSGQGSEFIITLPAPGMPAASLILVP